jgi:hypothetical protein
MISTSRLAGFTNRSRHAQLKGFCVHCDIVPKTFCQLYFPQHVIPATPIGTHLDDHYSVLAKWDKYELVLERTDISTMSSGEQCCNTCGNSQDLLCWVLLTWNLMWLYPDDNWDWPSYMASLFKCLQLKQGYLEFLGLGWIYLYPRYAIPAHWAS